MKNLQQLQAGITRNQARIIDLLGWNAATYAAFMYNCGLQFLEHYVQDEEAINLLTPRQQFWNWWKLLYNARDEAFVMEWDGYEDAATIKDLRAMYEDIHNPQMLAGEIHPPKIVYGKDFTIIQMAIA